MYNVEKRVLSPTKLGETAGHSQAIKPAGEDIKITIYDWIKKQKTTKENYINSIKNKKII